MADPAPQPASPSTRRDSISSQGSARSSQHGGAAMPGNPRFNHVDRRFPSGARQASVSMFTGLSQQPTVSQSRNGNASPTMSPGTIDRVFPVRSVVSIDPTATPAPRLESSEGFPGMDLHMDSGIAERRQRTSETARQSSVSNTRQTEANTFGEDVWYILGCGGFDAPVHIKCKHKHQSSEL
jgi:hypothetical protein